MNPFELKAILEIILSAVLGGIIGIERETSGKSAGFRTHILVAVASTVFTIISKYNYLGIGGQSFDPSRMAGQVVVGIGFIGAGVIMLEEHKVRGLTTAASLWMVAAVGMLVAVELYITSIFLALFSLIILYTFRWLEEFLLKRRQKRLESQCELSHEKQH